MKRASAQHPYLVRLEWRWLDKDSIANRRPDQLLITPLVAIQGINSMSEM